MRIHVTGASTPDGRPVRVVVDGGRIVSLDGSGPPADEVVDVPAGTVLPGLHDHHLHLFALAAARRSVDARSATGLDDLRRSVTAARREHPSGWLRVVGWRVGVAGDLDRHALDTVDRRPLRVQDHTGSRWFLNSAALAEVATAPLPPEVELDATGAPTGRLRRGDAWLRGRLGPPTADLHEAARHLVARGVTAVTDATVTSTAEDLAAFAALPFRVTAMTGEPEVTAPPGVRLGQVKVLLDDEALPSLDDLAARVAAAHDAGRAVAVHCVTRVQLLLTLAALAAAGVRGGDRVEHGSVIPPESVAQLARLGVGVATNPGFLAARGDTYLDEVDPGDRASLYRVATLLAAGVEVVGATDAPFGPDDPWVAIRAAVDRAAPSGRPVAPDEAVHPETAFGLFAGGAVTEGAAADLCVMGPDGTTVALTLCRGAITHRA